jgi:hypothetical protein
MVTGFYLTMEAPSRLSTSLCLLHSVFDKSAWLREREITESWPVAGLPNILPLYMRPALLAGVAIVERAGPEMLRMLRGHMMGDNRVRFTDATENMIARARRAGTLSQMQLI